MRDSCMRGSRVDTSLPIERRILNAVIFMVHARKQKPRAIYLTKQDYQLFRKGRRTYKQRHYVADIPVRIGKRSIIYAQSDVVTRKI